MLTTDISHEYRYLSWKPQYQWYRIYIVWYRPRREFRLSSTLAISFLYIRLSLHVFYERQSFPVKKPQKIVHESLANTTNIREKIELQIKKEEIHWVCHEFTRRLYLVIYSVLYTYIMHKCLHQHTDFFRVVKQAPGKERESIIKLNCTLLVC